MCGVCISLSACLCLYVFVSLSSYERARVYMRISEQGLATAHRVAAQLSTGAGGADGKEDGGKLLPLVEYPRPETVAEKLASALAGEATKEGLATVRCQGCACACVGREEGGEGRREGGEERGDRGDLEREISANT